MLKVLADAVVRGLVRWLNLRLSWDPALLAKLSEHADKLLMFRCQGSEWFFLLTQAGIVYCRPEQVDDLAVNTCLELTLEDCLSQLSRRGIAEALKGAIRLEGEVACAEALLFVLMQLRLDVSEELAHVFPAPVAQMISEGLVVVGQWLQSLAVGERLGIYLTEECNLLLNGHHLDALRGDVDDLQHAFQCLKVRMEQVYR